MIKNTANQLPSANANCFFDFDFGFHFPLIASSMISAMYCVS